MVEKIYLNQVEIEYFLEYKKVKNINLRIKPDCTVHVSANKRVSRRKIEEFMESKADLILNALEKYRMAEEKEHVQYRTPSQLVDMVTRICERVYPYFQRYCATYPQIKFRKMVSCWGNCRPTKGVITFNTNLIYAPPECVEYVVLHEFTHFIQANHSKEFYDELEKVCPNWKECRAKLRDIHIK